jgi:nitrate reductase alpha subunit
MSRLLERLTYFTRRREPFAGGHRELRDEDRMWEEGYQQRWQHGNIVRSTRGVNCTGPSVGLHPTAGPGCQSFLPLQTTSPES